MFELVVFGYEFRQNVIRLNHMAYCVINEREVYEQSEPDEFEFEFEFVF